jgi:hypothetical protein
MKTFQNHVTFNRMQDTFKTLINKELVSAISRENRKSIANCALNALIMYGLLITFYGCGKPANTPIPPPANTTGCAITGDVDQALGSRIFEYDDKGLLIKMTGPNYYYGPFVETITSAKVFETHSSESVNGSTGVHTKAILTDSYYYTGGSGNIYDGSPQFMSQVFTQSDNPPLTIKTDSVFQFVYDDAKKHLTTILVPIKYGSTGADGFTFFRYELNFTYDAIDNVTQVKIIYDYSQRINNPQAGDSHTIYKQNSDELLNITYDDKPSAYTAISKYWKFIGEDFNGFKAYNTDKIRFWVDRCTVMSKNNPVKITGKLRVGLLSLPPVDINANLTYQYNEKNFPVSMAINGSGVQAFTYNCK